MDIENEVAVANLLIRRTRKGREKRKPLNILVGKFLLKREEKGTFVLFHCFSWWFISLNITFVGFSYDYV